MGTEMGMTLSVGRCLCTWGACLLNRDHRVMKDRRPQGFLRLETELFQRANSGIVHLSNQTAFHVASRRVARPSFSTRSFGSFHFSPKFKNKKFFLLKTHTF